MSRARSVPAFMAANSAPCMNGTASAKVEVGVGREAGDAASPRSSPPELTASRNSGKTSAGTISPAGAACARSSGARACADLGAQAWRAHAAATSSASRPPPSSAGALERAAGLGEEDVVERRRVQLRGARSAMPSASSARTTSASCASPPSQPHRDAPRGASRHALAEALEHLARARSRSAGVARDRPRRVGRPISALSAAGVPSATIWPWSMIPTRSASTSASSRYCVVRKTVTPSSRARRATSSHSARAALRVEPGGRLVEEQDRAAGARARARGRGGASCRPSSRRPCGRPPR